MGLLIHALRAICVWVQLLSGVGYASSFGHASLRFSVSPMGSTCSALFPPAPCCPCPVLSPEEHALPRPTLPPSGAGWAGGSSLWVAHALAWLLWLLQVLLRRSLERGLLPQSSAANLRPPHAAVSHTLRHTAISQATPIHSSIRRHPAWWATILDTTVLTGHAAPLDYARNLLALCWRCRVKLGHGLLSGKYSMPGSVSKEARIGGWRAVGHSSAHVQVRHRQKASRFSTSRQQASSSSPAPLCARWRRGRVGG